ncbi:MAG: hypothetical protein GXO10_06420 [Crenarchaeota archaeon]|nr:hypothetical protein [Thermoproteota archaeon]
MVGEIVTLEFSPVDPIYVGSSGEFSPESRGPATLGRSLTMPLPSTVLGSFLNLAYRSQQISTDGTLSGLYEALRCLLSTRELYVRGPYLRCRDTIAILLDNYVIDLFSTEGSICVGFVNYVEYCIRRMLGVLDRKENPPLKSVKVLETIGIGIRRPIKAVYPEGRGLIYTIERVDLLSISEYEHDVSIDIDIVSMTKETLCNNIRKIVQEQSIVKFGGEGKIAKLTVEKDRKSLTEINLKQLDKATRNSAEYIILFIITPAILKIYDNNIITIEDVKRDLLLENDDVVKNSILVGKRGKNPISLASLGYNTVKNIRRPLRLCVVPGSFIIMRNCKSVIDNIRRYVIEGLGEGPLDPAICEISARYLGYGSIAVLPVSKEYSTLVSLVDRLFRIVENSQR